MTKLPLHQIRRDGGTQPRSVTDYDIACDYGDLMKDGAKFPAVTVFYDGENYWLADGFHRVEGAESAGIGEIDCDVHQGTVADAQWYSFGANSKHGLRRSNEDKQRAVKATLAHPAGADKSDREIARHVGVDKDTVSAWRQKMTGEIRQSKVRTGRDGRAIHVANIGRKSESMRPNQVDRETVNDAPLVEPIDSQSLRVAATGTVYPSNDAIMQSISVLATFAKAEIERDDICTFGKDFAMTVTDNEEMVRQTQYAAVVLAQVCMRLGLREPSLPHGIEAAVGVVAA